MNRGRGRGTPENVMQGQQSMDWRASHLWVVCQQQDLVGMGMQVAQQHVQHHKLA